MSEDTKNSKNSYRGLTERLKPSNPLIAGAGAASRKEPDPEVDDTQPQISPNPQIPEQGTDGMYIHIAQAQTNLFTRVSLLAKADLEKKQKARGFSSLGAYIEWLVDQDPIKVK